MRQTIEQRLMEIGERAAFVRGFALLAAASDEPTDAAALNGLGEVCADIERLAAAVRNALPIAALGREVKP